MQADLYFGDRPDHRGQPQATADAVSAGEAFAQKLFPVRPVTYMLVIAVLVLALSSVNEERSEALARSPLPAATAGATASVVRQSLPARAALYRENFLTH
jgi:hypothetical protein